MKYLSPGSTVRTELMDGGTRRIASIIISPQTESYLLSSALPSSELSHNPCSLSLILLSAKIILLYFPISSTISFFLTRSPSSSLCSISNIMIRSREGCVTYIILPPCKCFLRSMVKAGALSGAVRFLSVRHIKGMEALAEINSFLMPYSLVFTVIRSSPCSGSDIFDMYPSVRKCRSSKAAAQTVTPSKAIVMSTQSL